MDTIRVHQKINHLAKGSAVRTNHPDGGVRTEATTVCIVYDCLFPLTVGGAERWYRVLADCLVADGIPVTYLTRRQWDRLPSELMHLEVISVSGKAALYDSTGSRKLLPTLRFGWGVFRYLIRHRRAFGVVHLGNFPFFSVLAARLALLGSGTTLAVDWHEVWSRAHWRRYAGPVLGRLGFIVQRCCLIAVPTTFVFSQRNARLLVTAGARRAPTVLAGLLPSDPRQNSSAAPQGGPVLQPTVLFAGRHIADKGVDLLPDIFAAARRLVPDLQLVVAGDGPLRREVEDKVNMLGLQGVVHFVGFVDDATLARFLDEAACVLLPARREGYGMLVAEAAAHSTPAVVAAHPENGAVDLIEHGRNGFAVEPTGPAALALAVAESVNLGEQLRRTTADWYAERAPHMTIEQSAAQVVALHRARVNRQGNALDVSSKTESDNFSGPLRRIWSRRALPSPDSRPPGRFRPGGRGNPRQRRS